MSYFVDHPDMAKSEWEKFHRTFPTHLIKQLVDRTEIQLPEWFVPLARGVAFPSDQLLRRCGYRGVSYRPNGWRKTNSAVYIRRYVADKDGEVSTLAVRRYCDQSWWTIERYREHRKYEEQTDVLVFLTGSTPIFCWNYVAAMWVAEYCQNKHPPTGLRWVTDRPDDFEAAIKFARERAEREALWHAERPTDAELV